MLTEKKKNHRNFSNNNIDSVLFLGIDLPITLPPIQTSVLSRKTASLYCPGSVESGFIGYRITGRTLSMKYSIRFSICFRVGTQTPQWIALPISGYSGHANRDVLHTFSGANARLHYYSISTAPDTVQRRTYNITFGFFIFHRQGWGGDNNVRNKWTFGDWHCVAGYPTSVSLRPRTLFRGFVANF